MIKASPEYLQVSLAAAITLGLRKGLFYRDAKLHCLNLLLTYPSGCRAACTYCGLARSSSVVQEHIEDQSFIRVEWPVYSTDEILERAVDSDGLERSCISTLTHPDNTKDTLTILRRLKNETNAPVSILSNPTTTNHDDIQRLFDKGADRFTVALDLATEHLFERHRGREVKGPHSWDQYWSALTKSRDIFGVGNIGVHLIAGMGETEVQMAQTMQRVRDIGGTTHLFSFYPENGSALQKAKPCDPGQYRRTQLVRYLIDNDQVRADDMVFDDMGSIMDYGVSDDQLDIVINTGLPFETCGCPDKDKKRAACNRPFGDGPPTDIRSYPFQLDEQDVDKVRGQMINDRLVKQN